MVGAFGRRKQKRLSEGTSAVAEKGKCDLRCSLSVMEKSCVHSDCCEQTPQRLKHFCENWILGISEVKRACCVCVCVYKQNCLLFPFLVIHCPPIQGTVNKLYSELVLFFMEAVREQSQLGLPYASYVLFSLKFFHVHLPCLQRGPHPPAAEGL